jgi:DNA-binding NarL/FixJ family response regulator
MTYDPTTQGGGAIMIGVVVSESAIVAKAVAQALEGHVDEVAQFTRLGDVSEQRGDMLLIYDVIRPKEDVQSLLRFLHSSRVQPIVIVLTKETHDLGEFERLVGKTTAILPAACSLEDISLVARLAHAGLFMVPSAMVGHLQRPKVRFAEGAAYGNLTSRELGILGFIAEGAGNKLIARKLGISDATVRVHVRSVLRKIGVNNRTQAALFVMKHGVASSLAVAQRAPQTSQVLGDVAVQ